MCIYVSGLAGPPPSPPTHGHGDIPPPPSGFWVVGFLWFSNIFLNFSYYFLQLCPDGFSYCFLCVSTWGARIVFSWFPLPFYYVFLMFSLCFPCGFLLYFYSCSHLSLVFCTCAVCYGLLVVALMLSHGFK